MNKALHSLLLNDMKKLYDVEHQLAAALPKMAKMATSPDLKEGFAMHAKQTEKQILKLERAFKHLKATPRRSKSPSMAALILEGMKTAQSIGDKQARDAALIGAADQVEHAEMGAYESAWLLAQSMDHNETADILEEIREEEHHTSKLLNKTGKKLTKMSMMQMARGMMS